MYILTINGSSAPDGKNSDFLKSLELTFSKLSFKYTNLNHLPLFQVALDANPLPEEVKDFKELVNDATAVLISTPVYIYNMPAVLKSALEWLTSSGELVGKRVLAITYTPNPPRGEKAMFSLLNSLKALDTNVVASLALYHNELRTNNEGIIQAGEQLEMISSAIELLK